ncbi:MAG: HDOD domain-containing protein [Rhodobacterales bacterium]|nr:HDOD domain-containing protein [Rhodobacterales bacterium]
MAIARKLPAPPAALATILDAANNPKVSLPEIAVIIERDPSISATVLRVANSAAYRGSNEVRSIRQATSRIGVRGLRNLALCHAARSCVQPRQLGGFDLDGFWESSLVRAVALGKLYVLQGWDEAEGFTVGLLQELGVLCLVLGDPSSAREWMDEVAATPESQVDIEMRLFGQRHDYINAELAQEWSLPDAMAQVIAHHHEPHLARPEYQKRVALAGLGEAIARVLKSGRLDLLEALEVRFHSALGLTADKVDALVDEVSAQVSISAAEMGIRASPSRSVEDILRAANHGLVTMNLSYEELVLKLEESNREKQALMDALGVVNEELSRLSATDPLTGLSNRRVFEERLSSHIAQVARLGGGLALVVADIDHFKRVNDTWGHAFGDEVLVVVAEALREAVRTGDMVVRSGGEEFALLLPSADVAGAMQVAERALELVRGRELLAPDGQKLVVTLSLGVSWLVGPGDKSSDITAVAHRLYTNADSAMYKAKRLGRAKVVRYRAIVPWDATKPRGQR